MCRHLVFLYISDIQNFKIFLIFFNNKDKIKINKNQNIYNFL